MPSPDSSTSARAAAPAAVPSVTRRVVVALLLPLFFAIAFPLAFATATHAPTPHGLALTIAGPNQVVGKIASSLQASGRFAVEQTDVASVARSAVEQRDSVGAVLVQVGSDDSFTVTTYVANAAGRSAVAVVEAVGTQIASQLGTTATVVDVAPLAAEDSLGTNLFYLIVYASLGGYMVVIVMGQVWSGSRLATRYAAVGVTALLAPLLVFALSSIFVGDYGADFGTILALLGVGSLYVLTVGSLAILIQQFLGREAQFGVMALIVFLNFPSAGAASPVGLLPPFWQGVHEVWFGAGAFEAFRSIVYFGGAGASRWILQLLVWLVAAVAATVIVHLAKLVNAQRRRVRDLEQAAASRITPAEPALLPATHLSELHATSASN